MLDVAHFANRTVEIAEFRQFAALPDRSKRVIFFRTGKASGTSEFLRHLATTGERPAIYVYMDMMTGGIAQLADALKEKRSRSVIYRIGDFLQAGPISAMFSKALAIASIGLSPLARIGAVVLTGIGEGILIEPFPSLSTSRICRMAATWPKRDIYFLLDNAQKKAHEIIQLSQACSSEKHYSNVRFVLAITDETEGDLPYADFRRRLPFRSSDIVEGQFRPVDAEFVAALAKTRGINLEHPDCEKLAELAKNDLWVLLGYIDDSHAQVGSSQLNQTSKFLLRLLLAAEQPLRRSDMRLLVLRSDQIVTDSDQFEQSLNELQRRRLIEASPSEDGDRLVSLISDSAAPVRDLKQSGVANLAVARDLYEFFTEAERIGSLRHSESAIVHLLYRLAQDLDPAAVPARAQRLVDVAMSQGSLGDAERYIDIARRKHAVPSVHDLFVQVALYVSLQDYHSAKEVLDQIAGSEFNRYRVLRILDAVALNRTRLHAESNQKIDSLLRESSSSEEKALLVSYKISALLHEEQWDFALDVYNSWKDRLRVAGNFPYFLRNAAAVYMLSPNQDLPAAEKVLGEAIRLFIKSGDAFGEATTRCNYGVVEAYSGEIESAERNFRRSYNCLSIFGTQHIQESGANLGTALILLGQLDRARVHMTKLLPMMETNYPSIVTETNLAMLDMATGRQSQGLARLRALAGTASEVKILDCWRHVHLAAALVENVAGNSGHAMSLVDKIELKGGPSRTLSRIRTALANGTLSPEAALGLYRTDWMQYWSQNPLKMLPVSCLTSQPELHSVA